MKKIFTMMVLSIMAVMSAQAEETTLWEGSHALNWGTAWEPNNLDTPLLTKADFASYEIGQELYFYVTTPTNEDYRVVRFTKWNQAENSLGLADENPPYNADNATKITLIVTEDLKKKVAGDNDGDGGFVVCGYGVTLVKVTMATGEQTKIEDLEPALLWSGDATIDGWGGKVLVLTEESDGFSVFTEKLTKACNLYFLVEDATGGDFRISGQWGAWDATAYPSDGYNHMKTLDADNVVKVSLDETFVTKAFKEKGGIAFWGNGGFKIKAIATTKAALTGTDGISNVNLNDNVNMNANAPIFNLAGQRVSKNYKGVVIVNGKKYLNK